MENFFENRDSRSILVPDSENHYEEKILNVSFDENSFYNLNIYLNENDIFQPGFNNIFGEENENNIYYFNNTHNEEFQTAPNQVNIPIYNIVSNINNAQNDLNAVNNNLLGRKTKKSGLTGPHDKYAEDNRVRKVKVYLKDALFRKINSEIQKNKISINVNGKEYKVDGLLDINQELTINTTVGVNLKLFNTELKDYFSVISNKYRNYPKNYNKLIIEKLYKENMTNVTCILDIKFLDSLKYFRKDKDVYGKEEYSCLQGIEKDFEDLPKKFRKEGHDDRYINMIIDLINNFENIYYEKRPREKDRKGKDVKTKNTYVTSYS